MNIAFDIAGLIKNQPVSNATGEYWILSASSAQVYRSMAEKISDHLMNNNNWTFEECSAHVFNTLNPEKAFLSCAVDIDNLFQRIDELNGVSNVLCKLSP